MGADPAADLIVAICDDKYLATYSREYMKAYDPLLVLRVNGELALPVGRRIRNRIRTWART